MPGYASITCINLLVFAGTAPRANQKCDNVEGVRLLCCCCCCCVIVIVVVVLVVLVFVLVLVVLHLLSSCFLRLHREQF